MNTWISVTLTLLAALLHQCAGSQCGVLTGMTRVVGGNDVPSLRYPWYVALVVPDSGSRVISVSCGGSLITSRHVLSAAHCFPTNSGTRPENMYRAVFCLTNRCEQTNVESSRISRVQIYPSFNTQTLEGDVAVITLQKSVSYTPICLPPKGSVVTGEACIIGFGSTLVKSTSQYPCVLQEATVNILTRQQCKRSGLEAKYSRLPGIYCAGVLRGGIDSCDGDSGGPLQTQSSGIYTVQGIVSFGEGCGRKNLPGVYTQVSFYRDFIDRAIKSDSGDSYVSSGGGQSSASGYPSISSSPSVSDSSSSFYFPSIFDTSSGSSQSFPSFSSFLDDFWSPWSSRSEINDTLPANTNKNFSAILPLKPISQPSSSSNYSDSSFSSFLSPLSDYWNSWYSGTTANNTHTNNTSYVSHRPLIPPYNIRPLLPPYFSSSLTSPFDNFWNLWSNRSEPTTANSSRGSDRLPVLPHSRPSSLHSVLHTIFNTNHHDLSIPLPWASRSGRSTTEEKNCSLS